MKTSIMTEKTKALMGIKSGVGNVILSQYEYTYELADKAMGLMSGACKMVAAIFKLVESGQDDPNYDQISFAHEQAISDSEVNMPLDKLLNNATAVTLYLLIFGKALEYWNRDEKRNQ